MNKVIDMAARSMWIADGGRPSLWDETEGAQWRGWMTGEKPKWLGYATAAINAIREPSHAVTRAMAESQARDDEGQFEPLMDLIDFSGENKTHTVLAQAWRDAIDAILQEQE